MIGMSIAVNSFDESQYIFGHVKNIIKHDMANKYNVATMKRWSNWTNDNIVDELGRYRA